jgi:pantoate kinase
MDPIAAFSPGGITSFFEPYTLKRTRPFSSDTLMAARGGGFTTRKGTTTCVQVQHSKKNKMHVFINGRLTSAASTTEAVARLLLERTNKRLELRIEHHIAIPTGSGYGTSAAGALSTALALNDLLNLGMTYDEIGLAAHISDIRCRTGLGTVGPLMVGGCIIQREGGPPGVCRIDRIPIKPSYRLISGCYCPISKPRILNSKIISQRIAREGRRTMRSILSRPDLKNFLNQSEEFALKIGFMTERIADNIRTAKRSGSVGATQNMLGDAFHAVVEKDLVEEILEKFRDCFPRGRLFSSQIDFEGARLL